MSDTYELAIIGGGPAGAAAAIYAARKRLKTVMILEEWGGQSGVVFDLAHAYMENLDNGPKDPRLKDGWIGDNSWGLMDFAILPLEWPRILPARKAVRGVLDEPPWPDIGGKDWFFR